MDKIDPVRRSNNMRQIHSKDTKPEVIVRSLTHRLGYRFRLHRKDLPGKPDLVFGPRRKVIFVHGCFWHQHSKASCLDGRLPKSNSDYWHAKLRKNIERDTVNRAKLNKMGWRSLVLWECQLRNEEKLGRWIKKFLDGV